VKRVANGGVTDSGFKKAMTTTNLKNEASAPASVRPSSVSKTRAFTAHRASYEYHVRRWPLLRIFFTMLAFIQSVPASLAQNVAGRFPEANQVVADYPEQARAHVALDLLWDPNAHRNSMAKQRYVSLFPIASLKSRLATATHSPRGLDNE
jgi:hypothetical protein